ncbi:MAG: FtsX-like permease family protein [Acidimicrobiales bacterium]|nr:FtsX-like permease family protein [Acidimicrobiales bacterium]
MIITKLSLRGIRNNLGRLALTVLAITLGVGFVSGSFIISDSLGKVFDSIVERANQNLDARVQPITDDSFGQTPGTIPESLLDDILALDEVAQVDGFVAYEGANGFIGLDVDGEPQTPGGPPILTFSWNGPSEEGGGFELVDGSAPSGENSVAINVEQAEALGVGVGEEVTFQTPTGLKVFSVDGIVSFTAGGAWFTLFDLPTGQQQFDKVGLLDAMEIQAAPGVLPSAVLSAIEPLLPEGVEVIDQAQASAEDSEDFNQVISILGNILLGFALVALFVSLFIIYNTFAILVSQRIQQIGMLRAIGAGRGQIRNTIFIEAILVGVIGSVLGIVCGVGVAELIKALFESQGGFPETGTVISLRTVIVALIVGIVATLVSALLPAFKAGKISPVEAIRNEGVQPGNGRVRVLVGALITAVGLFAVGYGLTGAAGLSGTLTLLGAGAVFTFVGVALLSGLFAGLAVQALGRSGPVGLLGTISGVLLLVGGVALLVGGLVALVFGTGITGEITVPGQDGAEDQVFTPPSGAGQVVTIIFGAMFGALGAMFLFSGPRALADGFRLLVHSFRGGAETKMARIARENAARSPQRTAATATALMIGLALVTLVSVLGQSLKTSLTDVLDNSIGADLFVSTEFGEPLPDDFAAALLELEGIGAVSEYRSIPIRLGGPDGDVLRADSFTASTGESVLTYNLSEGSFDGLSDGTAVVVTTSLADDRGLRVGQTLDVEFEDGVTEQLAIAGIIANENFTNGTMLMDNSLLLQHDDDAPIESIGATISAGADIAATTDAAKNLGSNYPSVQVFNNDDLQQELESGINGLLVLINGLLGLALVVAFFGVVNTIVLSVLERTREIGLLRAVGMTRGQLMSTIRWEAIMVSLFGALLGIALGILFGIAGVRAIPDTVIDQVAIPWTTLAVIVVMSGLIGVLAAYLPARRAAKLNPLDAIATL